MSLIEAAIAKRRLLGSNSSSKGPKRPPAALERAVRRGPPAEPLVARPLRPDRVACSDNRVLLDENAARNAGAVAAYRILRTRLLQRARLHNWTSIGVTSAEVHDGKSLTALNLALSLARDHGTEVVLLDLDMRSPSICRYLGVDPPHSVLDFFEQRCAASDLFFSIGIDRLAVASGSRITQAASELLGTSQFEALLRYVEEHTANPIVLIDLPPLLRTDDTLVIAPRTDAMLLVVAEGRTDRQALAKAVELVGEFPLAGLILNHGTVSGREYGYGSLGY